MKISNSELQVFKSCKRKWWMSYYRKLQTPEKRTGALALGSRVHLALESYYRPNGNEGLALGMLQSSIEHDNSVLTAASEYEELAKLDKEAKLARTMVTGYFEWVSETGADSDLLILEAESEIEAEINVDGIPILLVGKRDCVGLDQRTGRKFFLDHKTCQSLNDPLLDLNEQVLMYALLHRMNTEAVEMPSFAIWNLLRKVLRTARATPPFYAREQIEISDHLLRNFHSRLVGTIRDLLRVRAELDNGTNHRFVCYPTPSSRCSWGCEFRQVCPMLDMDHYAEELLTSQYNEGDPYARYTEEKSEID